MIGLVAMRSCGGLGRVCGDAVWLFVCVCVYVCVFGCVCVVYLCLLNRSIRLTL